MLRRSASSLGAEKQPIVGRTLRFAGCLQKLDAVVREIGVNHRKGEEPRRYFRASDRCFQRNGDWYFATREGIDVGPYRTREAADAGAKRLAEMLHDVTDPVLVQRLIEHFKPAKDPWGDRLKR